MKALLFDCDGVLVDTERDGHRIAFNLAFKQKGFNIEWDIELYGKLLEIAGGKERMIYFFDQSGWPETGNRDSLIKELHQLKTDKFMQIIENGELPLRPGVARLIDEAIAEGIKLAVCSTSNERAVNLIVEILLGPSRKKHFSGIFAGDIVIKKKPDPEIYLLASGKLNTEHSECMVIEDSRIGLLAAKAAGMKCLITKSVYTAGEEFTEADLVVDELGDDNEKIISIHNLKKL